MEDLSPRLSAQLGVDGKDVGGAVAGEVAGTWPLFGFPKPGLP